MENKLKNISTASAAVALYTTTAMTASAQDTISELDRNLIFIEPSNILIGGLVAAIVGAVILTTVAVIKYLISRFSSKNGSHLASYMTFTSTLINYRKKKLVYPFWSGTRRMKAAKMLFDIAVLELMMALCRAVTIAVITLGFNPSYDFFQLTVKAFTIETTGQNLSVSIISVFLIVAATRVLEYSKYKKSAL